jgi:DnaA family protein
MEQLTLGMRLQDRAVFASFLAGDNALTAAAVRALASGQGGSLVYLHGVAGSGKSHLLQALCAQTAQAAYLPLAQLRELGPGVLSGALSRLAIAVDDLDAIAGDASWERALFVLFNDCAAQGTRLIVAARQPATAIGVQLPDLCSRLASMPHFALRPLTENQQRDALRLRAGMRGIEFPEETLQYLQRRCARDMTRLHALLDRLDQAALQEQRRLTIPFIRQVLDELP